MLGGQRSHIISSDVTSNKQQMRDGMSGHLQDGVEEMQDEGDHGKWNDLL